MTVLELYSKLIPHIAFGISQTSSTFGTAPVSCLSTLTPSPTDQPHVCLDSFPIFSPETSLTFRVYFAGHFLQEALPTLAV